MYNLKTRKKLKIYVIVRTEPSINENTHRPETKTMLKIAKKSQAVEIKLSIYASTKYNPLKTMLRYLKSSLLDKTFIIYRLKEKGLTSSS